MSNATQRNFGAAQRERQRRLTSSLEGEMPIGSLAVTGDPGWDAFFGSLHDKADEAAANGMNFRADLASIGRPAFEDPGLTGGLNPFERQSQKNLAMMRQGDATVAQAKAEQAAQTAYADQRRDRLLGETRAAYDEHVLDSAYAPPEPASITTQSTGADGKTRYSITNAASDGLGPDGRPLSAAELRHQRLLSSVPGTMRLQLEQMLAPTELAQRAQAEKERAAKASEAILAGGTLSDEALDAAADYFNQTGTMPALGQKDPGNRARILNRAGEKLRGTGGSVASNKADYKADAGSLATIQKQRDAIGAFESTAKKNMDVFLKTAEKIADTGSPLLNQPVRAVSGKVLGSENQAEYDAARAVLLPEIARIITNPNLTGVLSDSARNEVSSFNPETATLGQTIKVMRLLKQDMGNRIGSLDEQIKTIKGRIAGSGRSETGNAPKRQRYDMLGNPIKD